MDRNGLCKSRGSIILWIGNEKPSVYIYVNIDPHADVQSLIVRLFMGVLSNAYGAFK